MANNDNAANVKIEGEMHLVITGRVAPQYIEHSGNSQIISMIEIGTSNISKAVSSAGKDLDNIGMVSLDQLFCPYMIGADWATHESLPYWNQPEVSGDITATELNPFNPGKTMVDAATFYAEGPNVALYNSIEILNGEQIGSGDFSQYKNIYPTGNLELNSVKGVGFKTPIILTGWGYDIDGNPVPGDTGDPTVFANGAFRNPSLWKSGPLDTRWDPARGVWSAGSNTKIFLSKVTNTYNPSNYSYEVERSNSRDQFTRIGPAMMRPFNAAAAIYDPEYVAYSANPDNVGSYEQLDYMGLEFPHYEAFIIRQTSDDVGPDYYSIWTEDCQDCGHVSNPCPSGGVIGGHGTASVNKKILIENPLKQNLDTGDLCFTVKTGRKKKINTGNFVGGSGMGASGQITTNSSGIATFAVLAAGSGYSYGGFGIINSGMCASLNLTFTGGQLISGLVVPSAGFPTSMTYAVSVYPANVSIETEELDLHWILQAEFKTTQVNTFVGCDGGLLQTCSVKIQTQGGKSCEWCGEDTALTNAF